MRHVTGVSQQEPKIPMTKPIEYHVNNPVPTSTTPTSPVIAVKSLDPPKMLQNTLHHANKIPLHQ
jgi:hypothetical protein